MALFDSEHVDCIRLLRYRVYNVQKEHTHPKNNFNLKKIIKIIRIIYPHHITTIVLLNT